MLALGITRSDDRGEILIDGVLGGFEGFAAIDLRFSATIFFVLAFRAFLPGFLLACVESLPAVPDSIVEIAEPRTITTGGRTFFSMMAGSREA